MIYVISDIHGHFDKYISVINLLKENDTLYILGDVIDRGPDGIKILKDMMTRENVVFLMGNHELMMLSVLEILFHNNLDIENTEEFIIWTQNCNGGLTTYQTLRNEKLDVIKKIYSYLQNSYLIKRIKINDITFHLSHSFTIDRITEDLKFTEASTSEQLDVVWNSIIKRRSNPFPKMFTNPDEIYVFGHTPVEKFTNSNKIFFSKINGINVIDVDCGMAYNEDFSRLGCLRLNDLEEFYY